MYIGAIAAQDIWTTCIFVKAARNLIFTNFCAQIARPVTSVRHTVVWYCRTAHPSRG